MSDQTIRVRTAALYGIAAQAVNVDIVVGDGSPSLTFVGRPDAIAREQAVVIRSALHSAGYGFPSNRISVSVKGVHEGMPLSSLGLSVAIGLLAAKGLIVQSRLEDLFVLGELGCDGRIDSVRGVLPIAMLAQRLGVGAILLPEANLAEGAAIEGLRLVPSTSLQAALVLVNRPNAAVRFAAPPCASANPTEAVDLSEIAGQPLARRAVELAAAGGHNLLLVGPPGVGKTMLGRRVAGLLPTWSREEAIEATAIHSAAGLLSSRAGLLEHRPFRAPHHTVSCLGLTGGGPQPRPGEIVLAHRGVLFLDELPEFSSSALDVIRSAAIERIVHVGRRDALEFPAEALLIAAMNPCPCGLSSDAARACRCTPQQVEQYKSRIKALYKCFDLVVDVVSMSRIDRYQHVRGECSADVQARVTAARARQAGYWPDGRAGTNARLDWWQLLGFCWPGAEGYEAIDECAARDGRAIERAPVLRVARTIADLEGVDGVTSEHVAEALQFRREW